MAALAGAVKAVPALGTAAGAPVDAKAADGVAGDAGAGACGGIANGGADATADAAADLGGPSWRREAAAVAPGIGWI